MVILMFIVYTSVNRISNNIGKQLISSFGFEETKKTDIGTFFKRDDMEMVRIETDLTKSEFLDDFISTDYFVFLSSHSSGKGILSFTCHSVGNWTLDDHLGGRGKELGFASPINMLSFLSHMNSNNKYDIDLKYEATHHGPLLKTPSFFVEVGGLEKIPNFDDVCFGVAKSVVDINRSKREYNKIVIGIGGGHYPIKFTKLALEEGYGFSHILSKYNIKEVDMIEQAVIKSDVLPESAVIEWKSIKKEDKEEIIRRLELVGMDYVKV